MTMVLWSKLTVGQLLAPRVTPIASYVEGSHPANQHDSSAQISARPGKSREAEDATKGRHPHANISNHTILQYIAVHYTMLHHLIL